MCGRINVSDHPGVQALLRFLDVPLYGKPFQVRYNIAPGADLLSVFARQQKNDASYMHWGIVPSWANANTFSRPLINARSETIWQKPSFRELIKSQRVIIPVNGFYEWKNEKGHKSPYHIQAVDQPALALGGIYQVSKEGELQCCIVTTAANEAMSQIHQRMPVILSSDNMQDWLHSTDQTQINYLMQPAPSNWITVQKVSDYVNDARHEGEKCILPANEEDLFTEN